MTTTWTKQSKSGVTEIGTYLTLAEVDSDVMLLDPANNILLLNASVLPNLTTNWTELAKS